MVPAPARWHRTSTAQISGHISIILKKQKGNIVFMMLMILNTRDCLWNSTGNGLRVNKLEWWSCQRPRLSGRAFGGVFPLLQYWETNLNPQILNKCYTTTQKSQPRWTRETLSWHSLVEWWTSKSWPIQAAMWWEHWSCIFKVLFTHLLQPWLS